MKPRGQLNWGATTASMLSPAIPGNGGGGGGMPPIPDNGGGGGMPPMPGSGGGGGIPAKPGNGGGGGCVTGVLRGNLFQPESPCCLLGAGSTKL